MRKYEPAVNGSDIGSCFLIYADNGVGKTFSMLSLPGKIRHIMTEPRDPRLPLYGDLRFEERYQKGEIIFEESDKKGMAQFDDIMSYLSAMDRAFQEGKRPCDALFFDSMSFQQTEFRMALEDDRYGDAVAENKRDEIFTDRFRLEKADWGPLGSSMQRLCDALNRISKYGVTVVCTATMTTYPGWNPRLEAAPNFIGKMFPDVFRGYFDFIGWAEPNKGSDSAFPPIVRFVSDGTFTAKSCSLSLNNLMQKVADHEGTPDRYKKTGYIPLDFEKIIKVIKGEK